MQNCESKPKSLGEFNEICVIVSKEDKSFVFPYLLNLLDSKVNTPTEESVFKVNWIDSEEFFKYRDYNNLIIISLINPADSTGDLLFNKFKKISDQQIFYLSNTFSDNQLITVINAFDSIQFSDIINNNKDWINNVLNEHIYKTLLEENSRYNINQELVQILNDSFNINMRIDENYHLIKEKDNFLWIGRGYPYRWIIVNRVDDEIARDSIFIKYKDSIHKNIDGLIIKDTFKTIEYNRNYIKLTGLYEHNESDTGGPFISYCYKDNLTNGYIFISGFVNNPGKSKYKLLKQLESIIINNKRINNGS